MKRVIEYQATHPEYSDVTQTFISTTWEGIEQQQYEHEEYLRYLAYPYNVPYTIKSITDYDANGKKVW